MLVRFRDRTRNSTLPLLALLATACGSSAPPREPRKEDGAPATALVRDGLDADRDQQEQRTSLFANWDDFLDPEGFPVVYEWCIGTAPGSPDVMQWTFVGGAVRASTVDTNLPIGVPLYVNVRATDIAGKRSATANSDGIVLGQAERGVEKPASQTQPQQSQSPARPEAAPSPPPAPAPLATPPPAPVDEGPSRPTSLERHGITWTFSQPVECGRFVNGDWWVVGSCEIVSISPASTDADGRTRHGSMINPDPRATKQGYDSAMFGAESAGRFDPKLNVALGISNSNRLRLEPGSSLVSTVSLLTAGELPQLESCAVLTCLHFTPPKDAFRPPYCGTDKQCRWLGGRLDMHRLARIEPAAPAPTPGELAQRFERTWLDHVPGWTGRYLHPRDNMPDYGRDIADLVGNAALVLQLEYGEEEKRPLAIAMVQLGIDIHGIVQNGGRFIADGGSGSGRKFPVLFAGAMLQDRHLLACARDQKLSFAEDAQTFYVEQTSPGVWNRGYGDYGPDDAGLPDWGIQHADDPSFDRKAWTSNSFRRCCTANVWSGFVLATRIMGLRDAWGHPALFDYVDRYMQIEAPGSWMRAWTPFVEKMWDRYRPEN